MNIIIPMAGMGKRLRPHTLTTPKPLLPVAGKPIVQRLVEDIAKVIAEQIDEIAFVIGEFGKEVENQLLEIAQSVGAKGSIHYQHEALGTAHAILCAEKLLVGKVVVAYADTLFRADFKLDDHKEGAIWVKQVATPEQFGVVKLNDDGSIEGFYEKPKTFISDLAIIGIYYFRDGEYLHKELQYLLDQKITTGGEYGITDALQNMMKKGTRFHTESVEAWLDCGNKDATVDTNKQVLAFAMEDDQFEDLISDEADIEDSLIVEPCFIGKGAVITHSVIGPYVSVGEGAVIHQSVIRNSIIQNNAVIEGKLLQNSMIGKYAKLTGQFDELSLGDYNELLS
ncbi:MAG: glucose-1-phosphate thymidylyltransferase [Bacteroidetes bacterium]|nr:MAG: glucose-1-phosphate thymidylyltransferase [Bacteroidota bacterium]